MINISEGFKSKFKSDDLKINVKITIENNTYDNSNLLVETLSLTESLSSRSCFEFADVESSQIKFTLINDESIPELTGKIATIVLEVGTDTLPYGVYKLSVEKSGDLLLCTGLDLLYKLDVNVASWYNGLSYPITHKNMVLSLCTYVGLEHDLPISYTNHDIAITKAVNLSEITGREFLGYLNELACGWFTLNRLGKLVLVQLSSSELYPSETLFPSTDIYPSGVGERYYPSMFAQENIDISEFSSLEIDKLVIRSSDTDIGTIVGNGTNTYIIEGNILTFGFNASDRYNIATEIFEVISGIQYASVKGDFIGLPYLEKGDFIQVTDQDNHIGKTFLLNRTLNGINALIDTIDVQTSYSRDEVTAVNRDVKVLKNKTNELYRTVDTLSSTITDVEAGLQSQITQNAGDITLKVSKNDVINQINVSTEGISISASKINLSGYATFTSLSTSGSTTINADNITTGIISANRIASQSITANKIALGTLTANQIASNTITAAEIATGAITADKISGKTLSGINFIVGNDADYGNIAFVQGGKIYNYPGGGVGVNTTLVTSSIRPVTDDSRNLGASSYRWDNIYATNTVIQSSDRRLKKEIEPIEKGIDLIYSLKPIQFKWLEKERLHYGFVAQDFKEAMDQVGISDCGAYIDGSIKEEADIKGLRYSEIIAPLVMTVQDQHSVIDRLINRVNDLERMLYAK